MATTTTRASISHVVEHYDGLSHNTLLRVVLEQHTRTYIFILSSQAPYSYRRLPLLNRIRLFQLIIFISSWVYRDFPFLLVCNVCSTGFRPIIPILTYLLTYLLTYSMVQSPS